MATSLRPGEIKDILLREIEAADLNKLDVEEIGTVLEVKDGIARIYGLRKAMAGEMLEITAISTGERITALALNHLIEWISSGKTPPRAPYITVEKDQASGRSQIVLDEHGNAKGGVRNIWVDVPTAVYGVLAKGKTQAANFLCQIAGTKVRLPEPILKKLYKNKEDYAARVDRRLSELVSQGWFLPEYVETVHNEVKAAEIP